MDPDEQLVPNRTELRPRREDAGLYGGIACIVGAVGTLWFWGRYQRDPFPSYGWMTSHGHVMKLAFIVLGIATVLCIALPTAIALFMLWKAFLRGDMRDRILWAAAMILTSQQVVSLVLYGAGRLFALPPHLNIWTSLGVTGTISYAAAFLVFYKDGALRSGRFIAVICAAVMPLMFAAMFALGLMTWVTFAFSVSVSAGCWLVGSWLASLVGVNVYGACET